MGCDIHMHVEYKEKGVWQNGNFYRKDDKTSYIY